MFGSFVPGPRLGALRAAFAILALAGAAAFATVASAGATVSVSPAADAYVNSDHPTNHYGSASMLRVDTSPTMRSYLRFDLRGLAGSIQTATLEVYANSRSASGYEVHTASIGWSEGTIDYRNAPKPGSKVAAVGKFEAGSWTKSDVTGAVRTGTEVGFVLVGRSKTQIDLASRNDSNVAHQPILVLTLAGASAAQLAASATPPVGPANPAVPAATTSATAGSTATARPTATATARPSPTPTPSRTLAPTPAPTSAPAQPPAAALPNFSHVYVIYFENREYSSVVGSSQAPFINSLIAKYGSATNFYAERHPSEPNYIALTSGGTQGITDDGVYNLSVNNLYKQVEASGRTWAEVEQGWPGGCFTGTSSAAVVDGVGKSGSYVRKHNPAISYTSISGSTAECSHITNMASFNPAGASFQFITPNMINDMHDGSIADGDNWLKAFLPQITNSSAFANSVVFITFDEGSTNVNGGGHIPMIVVTPHMTAGYKATATYNHYSLLRTIEQAWGLPYLGSAASASPMSFPW
jgi:hypothetical protein